MDGMKGKTVLITGGSRGIGAACVRAFSAAGANVVFTYAKAKKYAEKTAESAAKNGRCPLFHQLDLASSADCARLVRKVLSSSKRIDVLVNNAGIWEEGAIGSMTEAEWDRTIDINLTGIFRMCTVVVPVMKKQRAGRIINISSTAGQRGEPFHSHYAASKGGVIAFTKSLAIELISYGIHVNGVAPGWVTTDMTAPVWKNGKVAKSIYKSLPRGRFGTPEEIAGPILFLASDMADNIVGETINVNGGSVLF
ncbi:MAG TPA: 3-oxoacyl-ACP reductase family protein [Bacteroidota bacterium]|nr:3-oxoacyl-ACP reductase family protein [Bacteroidota bacterium]